MGHDGLNPKRVRRQSPSRSPSPSPGQLTERSLPQALTDQILSTLHTLRTTTTPQITSAKESVAKADGRVGQSRRKLSRATEAIGEANNAVSPGRESEGGDRLKLRLRQITTLEMRLVEEESMLSKIGAATQLMLCALALQVVRFAIADEPPFALDVVDADRAQLRRRPVCCDSHRVSSKLRLKTPFLDSLVPSWCS
jgi:hypothetical protein